MSKVIATQTNTDGAEVTIYALGDSGREVSIRVESSKGRLSYLDVLTADLPALLAAVTEALTPAPIGVRWTCPECQVTFTNPDDYAYGHDCEV